MVSHYKKKINKNIEIKILSRKYLNTKYLNWLKDKSVTFYTDQYKTTQSLNKITLYYKKIKKSKNDYLYGIFYKKKHVGNIKLGQINWRHKTGYISYFIGEKNLWGKGIGFSAINLISKLAKTKYKLKKLNAGCYKQNIMSQKILKKNKFKLEGVLKSQVLLDGQRKDQYLFGLRI